MVLVLRAGHMQLNPDDNNTSIVNTGSTPTAPIPVVVFVTPTEHDLILNSLQKSSNLSDLTSASAARDNLGLSVVAKTGSYNDLLGKPSLASYAMLTSPNFMGSPTAPTPSITSNNNQIATTAFVQNEIALLAGNVNSQPVAAITTLTTLVNSKLTTSLNLSDIPSPAIARNNLGLSVVAQTGSYNDLLGKPNLGGYASILSPTFMGIPLAPTPALSSDNNQIATTAFVKSLTGSGSSTSLQKSSNLSDLTSPSQARINLGLARVSSSGSYYDLINKPDLRNYASIISPGFVGDPTAPTPALSDNSVQIATTAFVKGVVAAVVSLTSFNGRTGTVTLNMNDVIAALGFTPYSNSNPADYQTLLNVLSSISNALPRTSGLYGGTNTDGLAQAITIGPGLKLQNNILSLSSGGNNIANTEKYIVDVLSQDQTQFNMPAGTLDVITMTINGVETENYLFDVNSSILTFDPISNGYGVESSDEVFFIYTK